MCNTDPTLEEVNEVVRRINGELYGLDENLRGLELRTDGFTIMVVCGGQYLWNSEDDPREEDISLNREGLQTYLVTQIRLTAEKVLQLNNEEGC